MSPAGSIHTHNAPPERNISHLFLLDFSKVIRDVYYTRTRGGIVKRFLPELPCESAQSSEHNRFLNEARIPKFTAWILVHGGGISRSARAEAITIVFADVTGCVLCSNSVVPGKMDNIRTTRANNKHGKE